MSSVTLRTAVNVFAVAVTSAEVGENERTDRAGAVMSTEGLESTFIAGKDCIRGDGGAD